MLLVLNLACAVTGARAARRARRAGALRRARARVARPSSERADRALQVLRAQPGRREPGGCRAGGAHVARVPRLRDVAVRRAGLHGARAQPHRHRAPAHAGAHAHIRPHACPARLAAVLLTSQRSERSGSTARATEKHSLLLLDREHYAHGLATLNVFIH